MTNPNSPLTDDHLSQINNGLTLIAQAESQILLAKQAGINVDAAEKQLTDAKTKLIALKRTYFPNS
jgi:hypothetical protein